MAANTRPSTRLQYKRARGCLSRREGDSKRKACKESLAQIDVENVSAGVSCSLPNRRSVPLEHESAAGPRNNRKAAKTELSAKQRRTLCDKGGNSSIITQDAALFPDRCHHHLRPVPAKLQVKTTARGTWPQKEDYDSCTNLDTDSGSEYVTAAMDSEVVGGQILEAARSCRPEGITDIDAQPDSLTTNIYAKDISDYLMVMETRDLLKPGFLDNSPDVTSRMRGVLMDWLLQVQDHEELRDETLHLCVTLIDRVLGLVNVKMPKLQLVGITCLLIASKFYERFAPDISTLCYLTDNTFVKEQVLCYERFILQTLQFNLSCPVTSTFLDRYLQVHQTTPQVEYMARYLLDLSITNVTMVTALPSMKAASALYLARLLLLDSVPGWTPDLTYYTTYTTDQLMDWTNELISLLVKAPDSKFQGARNKYNTESCCYISRCDYAEPGWVLLKKYT